MYYATLQFVPVATLEDYIIPAKGALVLMRSLRGFGGYSPTNVMIGEHHHYKAF